MYINPDECVDCGACKSICRMDAIYYETDLPIDQHQHLADNAAFLRDLAGPRWTPRLTGGAAHLGPLRVDTPLVSALPPRGS
jgi:ferredoxin